MVYDIILSEWAMGLLLDLLDMQCDMLVAEGQYDVYILKCNVLLVFEWYVNVVCSFLEMCDQVE